MGRIYTVTFGSATAGGVLVSAAQDLVQITGATGKLIRILRQWVQCGNTTLATGQMLQLRSRFLAATVTVGSGGTTGITPSKVDPGDAACSTATCAINNTTIATTSGTGTPNGVMLWAGGCHLYQGHDKRWENPPVVHVSTAFTLSLFGGPSGTVNLSGGVELEEIG